MNDNHSKRRSRGFARASDPHMALYRTDWLAIYQREVKPRLTVDNVFGELPGARVVGGRLRAPCPLHSGRHLSFAIDPQTLRWFCHSKCGEGGGPLEFIHRARGGIGNPRGSVFLGLVKELCTQYGLTSQPATASRHAESHDVDSVWSAARPVTDDVTVARWLADERALDPSLVATCDLARVVRPTAEVPRWAGFERDGRWRSWPSVGYRVIVPLFDSRGALRSLRFRKPQAGTKGRSATGVPGAGLVMADAVARAVLKFGDLPSFWSGEVFAVVIAEGEPDFWSWTTEPARRGVGYAATSMPAVIGVVSGSFDQSIAARLPIGTHVTSAMDRDGGGDRIHARLARVLAEADRGFALSRWSPA